MPPHQQTLAKILTYSGTLPLVICTLASHFYPTLFHARFFAVCYGAVIISFLSGVHWASYLFFAEKCPRNLLLTSNATALIAWLSLLIYPSMITYLLQALCFLYLLTLDLKLKNCGILPQWFYSLRRSATIIVVLAISLLMVGL